MKQTLQLKVGQHLTMTPQLQQAIRLLQLSTLELQTEIQQALESNLMLELDEEGQRDEADPLADELEYPAGEPEGQGEDPVDPPPTEEPPETDSASRDDIPDDLPVDSDWGDVFDGSTAYSEPEPDSRTRDPYDNRSSEDAGSLREHLLWQAEMDHFSDRDRAIAETIIDGVGEDGYLTESLEELQSALPEEWGVELAEIEAVLRRVQRFDPVGVAARDPQEALAVQLHQLPPETPWREEAMEAIEDHLQLVAGHRFDELRAAMDLEPEDLQAVMALIRTLSPRPGTRISAQSTEYVVPDVVVRRREGRWTVELNSETAPRLRINPYYASLIRRADSSPDNTCLRNHLQEARWLLKSLRSRNETLLKVAAAIVERQQGFLDHGEEAMQPLVLREVAEAVEMHESTISRITTQKYMHTPRGTYEFKYFFSSHVQTSDGGEASATAIRARIKRLVAAEEPGKPLSDSRLARLLQDEGIQVARRTVAKYREAMSIPSSSERRRMG